MDVFGLTAWDIASIALLVVSLCLLGTGYFKRTNVRHMLIAGGELLFGLYWLTYTPIYWEKHDIVNLLFCCLALPFFAFIAYHEYLCYERKEELRPLDWIAGTALYGAGIYFAIAYIPFLHWALVYAVAYKSAMLATVFGYQVEVASLTDPWMFMEHEVQMLHNGRGNINIVLACTGVQAIALFIGFIAATRPDRRLWIDWAQQNRAIVERRIQAASGFGRLRLKLVGRTLENLINRSDRHRLLLAFLFTVPVIYITNLARNAALVYVVYEHKLDALAEALPGHMDGFDLAHNYITKALALGVMLFMLLLLFEILPELQENVLGLMDVFRYRKKDNVKHGFVELEFDD